MEMKSFYNQFKRNFLSPVRTPIQSLELFLPDVSLRFEVGRVYGEESLVKYGLLPPTSTMQSSTIAFIQELGERVFGVYAMRETGEVFLLNEIQVSISTTVTKTFFNTEKDWAETVFSGVIPEGSTSVRLLYGFWFVRDDDDKITVAEASDLSKFMNRNVGHFTVVCTDNFDRENRPERFVLENFEQKEEAERKAAMLNDRFGGENSDDYFKVVTLPYQLFEPDF